MKVLLKQVNITDPSSPHHGLVTDILIENGSIHSIGNDLNDTDARLVEGDNIVVSQGWVDIFAHFNDPGIEYKETIETGAEAAIAGGFTNVFVLPNTVPSASGKSVVEYIVQKGKSAVINILPLGAVTKNIEGKDLAEMYDMKNSGAIAFTDGISPVQTPGLLLKALQYVKAFNGTIIQLPVDKSIGKHGLMNEGITSTRLGLPGIPSIAEELTIARDIELVKYTASRLHITGVTTAKGIELIKEAKNAGVNITCSVTPHHLFFCDEDLVSYDTNLKVDPPLRSRQDMMALRKAVEDGTVDCIASHHQPQDWDHKICEFEYAHNGIAGLQTSFAVTNHILPSLTNQRLAELFSDNARKIFGLPAATIQAGNRADLTIFSRNGKTLITKQTNKSRCSNSPFINIELNGNVLGSVTKDKLYLNT